MHGNNGFIVADFKCGLAVVVGGPAILKEMGFVLPLQGGKAISSESFITQAKPDFPDAIDEGSTGGAKMHYILVVIGK